MPIALRAVPPYTRPEMPDGEEAPEAGWVTEYRAAPMGPRSATSTLLLEREAGGRALPDEWQDASAAGRSDSATDVDAPCRRLMGRLSRRGSGRP
jgi:hypothetical protein